MTRVVCMYLLTNYYRLSGWISGHKISERDIESDEQNQSFACHSPVISYCSLTLQYNIHDTYVSSLQHRQFHSCQINVHTITVQWFQCYSCYTVITTTVTFYTCQLSCLRHESHACGLKTSISHWLRLVAQILTHDWLLWGVVTLLDTISQNM